MHPSSSNSTAGEIPSEYEALIERYCEQMHRYASRMLYRFPKLRRWEETGDVAQLSLIRLLHALQSVSIQSELHFCRLASMQVRRTLIDLARSYSGPFGLAMNHESRHRIWDMIADGGAESSSVTPEDWEEFHLLVDSLSDEHRAMFDLVFYSGFSTEEIARILETSPRTVQRRWRSARLALCGLRRGRQ